MTETTNPTGMMLGIMPKKGEDFDPSPPIREYIESRYSPEDAAGAEQDLETLTLLRSECLSAGLTQTQRRETLLSYYRALRVVEGRFPVSKQAGHVKLKFTWSDAFDTKGKCEIADVKFERCAVLFNLACAWCQSGCDADRDDADGAKVAAHAFQNAAGVFCVLEQIAEKATTSKSLDVPTMDVSKECAAALAQLCLAQAQKCVFDKASRDGKSAGVLVKLARQCYLFYAAAKTALETPPLCDHVDKSWRAHIEAMASLHFAEAEVAACAGLADDEDGVGAKIARLQRASQVLGVGAKFVKSTHGVSVGLVTTLMTLKDTVDRDLAQATRENEVVYMVRVPAYEDLPELGAAAMVKATPPAPAALDASGESLFSNIVPESGFKALSKYTELVDTTIREEIDVLALASDEARAALAEMELPELLIAAEAAAGSGIPGGARNAAAGAGAGLPTPLAEELAAAQRGGVSVGFRDDLARLREAHDACAHRVDAAERALDAEASEDEACRDAYGGDKWTRPASAALTSNLREKISTYRGNLAQSFRSDESLHARVADASDGVLRLLEPDAMAAATPALRAPMVSTGDGDVVSELRAAVTDLEAIGAERAGIDATAKAIKDGDNIMAKVMAVENPETHDALFATELAKYDKVKSAVALNVSSQSDVLGRLRAQHDFFLRTYDVDGWRAASAIHVEATRDALAHFKELSGGIERGSTFYAGFAVATAQLLEETTAWVESRRREKSQLEATVAQRAREAAEVAQNHAAAAAAAQQAAADQAAAARAAADARAAQHRQIQDPFAAGAFVAPPHGVGYPPQPTSPHAPPAYHYPSYPPQPQHAPSAYPTAPQGYPPPPPQSQYLYPPNPYGQQPPPPPPHGYR